MSQLDKPIFNTQLDEKWIKHCADMPETGMGFQKVVCKVRKNGNEVTIPAIITNCQYIESVEPIVIRNIVDISLVD